MLTKDTPPKLLKVNSTVKCGDIAIPLALTFNNYNTDELSEFTKSPALSKMPEGSDYNPIHFVNAQVVLFVVKSFDDGTDKDFPLTLDGLIDMEKYYPGVLMGLLQRYHEARSVSVEKN